MVGPRERRWLIRRVGHEILGDPRPATVAVLGVAMLLGCWWIPFAKGMPFARGTTLTAGLLTFGVVLSMIAAAWWRRIAMDALLQHLLVLRRCGRCGHPAADRGPRSEDATPFACHSWRCSECGSEWVGAGSFPDAETRRDAA